MNPATQTFHLSTLPRPITVFEWERVGPIAQHALEQGASQRQVEGALADFGLRLTESQRRDLKPVVVGAGCAATAQGDRADGSLVTSTTTCGLLS